MIRLKHPTKQSTIVVNGVEWRVPRGFGRAYMRAAKDELALIRAGKPGEAIGFLIDILGLIGYSATIEQIADWPLRQRVEAGVYAATVHARAGDNPVQRHPRPEWIPERAWQGPRVGQGAFEGPTGTPIPVVASSTCCWKPEHDMVKDVPIGLRCGAPATHRIVWLDGSKRVSLGCSAHLELDPAAPRHRIEKIAKRRRSKR